MGTAYSRGQYQSSGHALILVIILVLVLYVIFLPPEQREELLNSGTVTIDGGQGGVPGSGSGDGTGSSYVITESDEFVFEGPGRVDYVARGDYVHDIPAMTIFTKTDATVLFQENTFTIERGWFTNISHQFTFTVDAIENVDNVAMTFSPLQHDGTLTIFLNGNVIYRNLVTSTAPVLVLLRESDLQPVNTIRFETSGVGLAFWKANRFVVDDLAIQADTLDTSRSSGEASFSIRAVETINLERAQLRFVPECDVGNVGSLSAYINNKRVLKRIPDCGITNVFDLDKSILVEGTNTLEFVAESGTYLIDNIRVDTQLDDDRDYAYYFSLNDDLFDFKVTVEEACGVIDGVCPANCGEDVDKDCCFEEYNEAYWCDVPTQLADDRCVGTVTTFNVNRCASGYEDESGDPDEDFEGRCGDDDDGVCPLGCSIYYDKDCCFDRPGDQYFCDDLTLSGVADICVDEISQDMCGLCAEGYDGEDSNPRSCYEEPNPEFQEVELNDDYEVYAKFIFANDYDDKVALIRINGFATRIDTKGDFAEIKISDYVKDNSNYIQIIPESQFDLVEVRVDIDSVGNTRYRR